VRADLLLQIGPSPPLERGAPRLDSVGPELRPMMRRCSRASTGPEVKSRTPVPPKLQRTNPSAVDASRKLNNIIGDRGHQAGLVGTSREVSTQADAFRVGAVQGTKRANRAASRLTWSPTP
jgi:hypothetical protein